MNYFDHNDQPGADVRYIAMACKEARARYLATLAEYESQDFGITLFMSKHELQQRCAEARRMHCEA